MLDSVASNACAHYLHNLFFILGSSMSESAFPEDAEVQVLRANRIESFDTCILRMHMAGGAKLFYAVSHAAGVTRDPEFVYEFENATVTYQQAAGSRIVAHFTDGSEKDYGDPFAYDMTKLENCISCINTGAVPVCTAETAIQHTRIINSIHRSAVITDFAPESLACKEDTVYVKGLFALLQEAYRQVYEICMDFKLEENRLTVEFQADMCVGVPIKLELQLAPGGWCSTDSLGIYGNAGEEVYWRDGDCLYTYPDTSCFRFTGGFAEHCYGSHMRNSLPAARDLFTVTCTGFTPVSRVITVEAAEGQDIC